MVNSSFGVKKSMVVLGLEICLWCVGIAITLLAVLQKYDDNLDRFPHVIVLISEWFISQAWWMVIALPLTGAIAKLAKQQLEAAWVWTVVKSIVDRIRQDAFKGAGGPQHFHRATLFRRQWKWWISPFKSSWWPWGARGCVRGPSSGWLVPVVRSGVATQKSSTVFLAPDDVDHAEGFAGFIWSLGDKGQEGKTAFPRCLDATSTSEDVADYARETRVSPEWVRQQIDGKKILSASFAGIPIEVKGQTWGVLILDSRDPAAAVNVPINIAQHAFVLGKLLERV